MNIRQNCEVAVYVNVKQAMRDGLKFYRSSNNVILCGGDQQGFIRPGYFLKAVDLKNHNLLDF